jgi:hypothetical protein
VAFRKLTLTIGRDRQCILSTFPLHIRSFILCLARGCSAATAFPSLVCSQDNPWFGRAETGKLARRSRLDRPELPTVQSWPMQFPQPAFLAFFCFSTAPKLPTLLPTPEISLFFETYFFLSLVKYRSPSFPSHSQRRRPTVPCRSLATTLACLTRVTVSR